MNVQTRSCLNLIFNNNPQKTTTIRLWKTLGGVDLPFAGLST
jgi:hypothetical protein